MKNYVEYNNDEHKPHKVTVTETIFSKISYKDPITFGEIDVELQPGDVILHNHEEAEYASDHGHDPHWSMTIYRDRLETDDEFEGRMDSMERQREIYKKERYKRYLKLKEEFDPPKEVETYTEPEDCLKCHQRGSEYCASSCKDN